LSLAKVVNIWLICQKSDRSGRSTAAESSKVVIEGRISMRADVRPLRMDGDYLNLKMLLSID